MKKYLLFIFIVFSLFSWMPTALAFSEKTTGGNLTATFNPPTPRPGQTITIDLKSFQVDLDLASIEWLVDEETVAEGVGLKTYQITAGDSGNTNSLIIRVTKPDGGKIIKTITFLPASIDLIYSTDSYTPAFYRGHSLPSPGSSVRVTAITNFSDDSGNKIPDNKLLFSWKVGSDELVKPSGLGKNTATIKLGDLYNETSITVSATDPTTETKAEKRLVIKTDDPLVRVYRADPLMGIMYNQALTDNYSMFDSEEIYRAEPYFFSLSDWLNNQLDFIWQVEGQKAETTGGDKRLLSLSRPESGNKTATIGLSITNKRNMFQNTNQTLRIKY